VTLTAFLRAIGGYLRPYRGAVALLGLALIVDVAFENGLALSLKFLIDSAIVPRRFGSLVLIGSLLVGGGVVYALTAVGRDRVYAELGANVLNDIRERMFRHLQELPLSVHERLRPGDVVQRFSGDLSTVESALIVSLPAGTLALFNLLASAALLFALKWELALVGAVALPLGMVLPRLLSGAASNAADLVRSRQAELANTVHENVSAQPVVKAFGLEDESIRSFTTQLAGIRPLAVRASFLAWMMERAPNLSIVAVHVAILLVGAALAIHREISVGSLVAFNAIFLNVSLGVYGITFAIPELVRGAASYHRIEDLLREPADDTEEPDAIALGALRRGIGLREVTVDYGRERLALDRVSLEIARGESIALVGPSGSGKSTLIRMLLALERPTAGTITFDGHDLTRATRASLRAQIGVVFQDNFLFDTSIAANLRVASPAASDAELIEACQQAEIHAFIADLPDGYATRVGERGGRLSGGQRQRVAIARALLRRPNVLIFDEATSALDPATEAQLTRTLETIGVERTTISVTHRLASVVNADRIVVMVEGRIAEQGSHDELLARNGTYQQLWEKQSGVSVNDTGDRATVTAERLRSVPILADLDDALRAEVASALATERHGAGRAVCVEGEPGDAFYIVARGRLEVVQAREPGEARLGVLEVGDFFGEIALITNRPRTATVRALTPTTLLSLRRQALIDLCERDETLRETLAAAVQRRLERSRQLAAPDPPAANRLT
jgi:ATP-binding cassette subfamily B protein